MNSTPYVPQRHINDHYDIVGFISSGTYGRVYKATSKRIASRPAEIVKHPSGRNIEAFAIKKFKPDKEGAELQYTGISQSAIREMALCTELSHPALIHLVEIILESKCIFMIFEYAEHDLLQIIHHHSLLLRTPIPASTLRSTMHQLLSGLLYLHQNWVIHRDLKPANIMVTSRGEIKIGDLGLARLFYKPLHPLFSGDKVVVTIWYRAPELLLGSRHYTPAIDLWAVGCIFAELLSLRPIFKGEEAKQDSKKAVPFQRNQMGKIGEVLGLPHKQHWPLLQAMPEYSALQTVSMHNPAVLRPVGLEKWYRATVGNNNYNDHPPDDSALDLLKRLLEYDPLKRLTAENALKHPYFVGEDGVGKPPSWNCFEGLETKYPARKVSTEANEISAGSLPGTKRGGPPDDGLLRPPMKKSRLFENWKDMIEVGFKDDAAKTPLPELGPRTTFRMRFLHAERDQLLRRRAERREAKNQKLLMMLPILPNGPDACLRIVRIFQWLDHVDEAGWLADDIEMLV